MDNLLTCTLACSSNLCSSPLISAGNKLTNSHLNHANSLYRTANSNAAQLDNGNSIVGLKQAVQIMIYPPARLFDLLLTVKIWTIITTLSTYLHDLNGSMHQLQRKPAIAWTLKQNNCFPHISLKRLTIPKLPTTTGTRTEQTADSPEKRKKSALRSRYYFARNAIKLSESLMEITFLFPRK